MLLLPDFHAFYAVCAYPACVSSYSINSGFRCVGLLAGGSPAATHFLLAKQKKVTCRRATPGQQNQAKLTEAANKTTPSTGAKP
ncbi:MAG: hypothetical protein H7335_13590 [Massilia sp.]|nr:hypothetical protein [Massilia sp.]